MCHRRLCMSVLLTIAALGIACAVYAQAVTSPAVQRRDAASQPERASAEELKRFESSRIDVDYRDVKLAVVLEDLSRRGPFPLHPRWPPLSLEGIDPDTRITFVARSVPFRAALDLILAQAAQGKADVGYDPCGGMIVVSAREDLARRREIVVYDVSDLIDHGTPAAVPSTATARVQPATAGDKPPRRMTAGESRAVQRIADFIETTIEPGSWRSAGGNVGSIRPLRRQLIVTQTEEAHREIRRVLESLAHCGATWLLDDPKQAATGAGR